MKIMLDVGANEGQTVAQALNPRFGFDRIVCFEPAKASRDRLARYRDSRIVVEPFGLWNRTCERALYEPGSVGASIFADKENLATDVSETCSLVRASDWFRKNIQPGDTVFLKLNCEGCECDIIDDLLDSGEYGKVKSMLAFLDVTKIESQKHRAAEVQQRLVSMGFKNYLFDNIQGGQFADRIRVSGWLQEAGADDPSTPLTQIRRGIYNLKMLFGRIQRRLSHANR